jgi:SAM-dependent methyltransferase
MNSCTLCNSNKTHPILKDTPFTYHTCSNCGLYFVEPGQRLEPGVEKSRYDQHENSPDDPDYRKFLSQLFDPLNDRLPPKQFGLDFGSGPGPALSVMFEEAGHKMNIFDPFYANNLSVFNENYDFITITETAEHLFEPRKEFEKLWNILKPGGYLGIMTKLLLKPEKFKTWHYRKDDTHVTFYQKETFKWLADFLGAEVEFFGDRVIILRKSFQ